MPAWPARRVTKPWVWYVLVGAVVATQLGTALVMATVADARFLGQGPQFLLPGLLVVGIGYLFWRSVRPPKVQLRQDGRWLVLEALGRGGRPTRVVDRFDLASAGIGFARWEYAHAGTMGTIVEVRAPEGTLRFAVKTLLPADAYDLPESYSYDLHFDQDAVGQQVLAAVQHASGASARVTDYRVPPVAPAFVIPLRPNSAHAPLPMIAVMFSWPVVAGLIVVPLSNGVTAGSILLALLGLLLGAAVVGGFLWHRRESRRYQLRLAHGQVMLEDRYEQTVVAQAAPGQLRVVPTYYTLNMRSGSWNVPSLSVSLPGFERELTIAGSGAEATDWMTRATKSRTAKYVVGVAEWEHLLRTLGVPAAALG